MATSPNSIATATADELDVIEERIKKRRRELVKESESKLAGYLSQVWFSECVDEAKDTEAAAKARDDMSMDVYCHGHKIPEDTRARFGGHFPSNGFQFKACIAYKDVVVAIVTYRAIQDIEVSGLMVTFGPVAILEHDVSALFDGFRRSDVAAFAPFIEYLSTDIGMRNLVHYFMDDEETADFIADEISIENNRTLLDALDAY
jgi:hypothetical protein